ncbi:MAG: hypothetical protein EOO88_45510 [Pedobacter sp.]|nr:MAG: hypothetical protein EOO88_45510 [Pedobacter sp.]
MKKIFAMIVAISLFSASGNAQNDVLRPAAIGISFIRNDYTTPERIRSSSLSEVLRNKQWAKNAQMSPGIGITYFKGLHKHIDFAGTLSGSFNRKSVTVNQPNNDLFLLEGDVAAHFKLVSDKYYVTPYIITGMGASMFGKGYFGARAIEQESYLGHGRSKDGNCHRRGHFVSLGSVELFAGISLTVSATHDRVVKTYVTTKAKRLYLRHNSFKELIPICIAFKAMGVAADKEILQLICGPDERYQEAFGVSLEEAAK